MVAADRPYSAAMTVAYLAAFGCAVAFGLATVLESIATRRVETDTDAVDARSLARVATQWQYLAGLGVDGLGWLLSLVALASLPLFVVESMIASAIGFTVLFAAVLQKLRPTGRQLWFIAAIALGLVGLAASGASEEAKRTPAAYTWAMVIALVVLAVAGWLVVRFVRGEVAASILGGLAGLAFGGTALCGRAILGTFGIGDLRDPILYALALYGALGMVLLTLGLQRGSVTVATAWLFVTQTVVPSAVGLVVLGDRARDGMVGLAATSFVVTVVAAVGLTLVSPPME